MTEKEMNILNAISSLHFMNTSQVHRLYGYGGKYGDVVTRKKLRELEERHLLKSWQPSVYEQKIYYLTKKGADELKHFYGYEQVPVYKKSDKTIHQVMITEIYCALRLEKQAQLRRFILNCKVGDVIADAFAEIKVKDGTKVLFIEADRATEGITHIRDVKLKGYKEGFHSGFYQSKYGLFPDICFITTCTTRERSIFHLAKQFPFRLRVFTIDEFLSNPMGIF